ncbi:MAG: DNA polymerase/3'-5' exonuclease PolX [Actinomycetota bacterium]
MTRRNEDAATALHEIADLLEIKGESRFRIVAYRRGADAIEGLSRDVGEMKESELVAVSGVGKGVAARVLELCKTGKIGALEKLRAEVPVGLRQMTILPGLGPKRAMQLFRELGVSSLDELKAAAEQHKIADVKGFSKKFEVEVLEAIERGVAGEQRVLLARALPLAQSMLADLMKSDAVVRGAYAGSLRRMRDTIGDIDLLVASDRPEEVMEMFRSQRGVATSKADGPTKASIVTTRGMQVDLRVVEPAVFGAALQYFTGSQAHNVKVRERAVRKGFKLSEYGLHRVDNDQLVASETEEEVYEALGMQWVPPTMREDRGEVEAAVAGELPEVVQLSDMRGDLQSHSTYSDGKLSVKQMAFAAAERGYEYFAVTDHGPRLTYMNNLGPREIAKQREEVAKINGELGGRMLLLHGVELNVGADGSLDYPDDVLAGFDICVASIHSSFKATRADQTKRMIKAIENPHVHVFGHPSGRRLDRREGVDFDVDAVAKAAAAHLVALEVNAHPYRLDLRDEHVRWARQHGVRLVISTDAHSTAELDNMHFGVATAQRGWAEAAEVINTWPLKRLRDFLSKGRK